MKLKTQLAELGLFDAKVPRYTSYPTAPHFNAAVGPAFFEDCVAQIPENAQISLYLHVPFCRRLCWFCACRTQGTQSLTPVQAYVETLKDEIRLLKNRLPAGISLSRLHWGGGTPTLLDPETMDSLCDTIFDMAPMASDGEFSIEIDPNEIDIKRLEILAKHGMNRASIGVQDFDPEIQETIGRIQSFDVTRDAIDMIRAQGVKSLNADILFGLPHQTPERLAESVNKLISLAPDRVALYGYAHVPWMAKRQQMIPSDTLPTPQERLNLFETAQKIFNEGGYLDIGIDHFAKPTDGLAQAASNGTLKRNFQGYTDDQSDILIGLGASSISRFPQGYAQNAPQTSAYAASIRDNSFATTRGHVFSGDDQLTARLIESLMCEFAVSYADIDERFGIHLPQMRQTFQKINAQFQNQLTVNDAGLFIPKEMQPLTRMIARAFDNYDSIARHSAAI